MTIDQHIASTLGFPKPEYTAIERERRWLCRSVPRDLVRQTEMITDLYVTGTRLRLREARPTDGQAPMLRLTRKADVDIHTRLITSIYLSEGEFAVLATTLAGNRIRKLRHRLHSPAGVVLLVDEFQGELEGLFIAEAELKTVEQLIAYPRPEFAVCEVTDDHTYTGGYLAHHGLPSTFIRG